MHPKYTNFLRFYVLDSNCQNATDGQTGRLTERLRREYSVNNIVRPLQDASNAAIA